MHQRGEDVLTWRLPLRHPNSSYGRLLSSFERLLSLLVAGGRGLHAPRRAGAHPETDWSRNLRVACIRSPQRAILTLLLWRGRVTSPRGGSASTASLAHTSGRGSSIGLRCRPFGCGSFAWPATPAGGLAGRDRAGVHSMLRLGTAEARLLWRHPCGQSERLGVGMYSVCWPTHSSNSAALRLVQTCDTACTGAE